MSRILLLVLLLVMSASMIIAQQTQSTGQTGAQNGVAATDQESETARIEGTVRSSSGEVIPRADLQLLSSTSSLLATGQRPITYAATSDAEGNFVIENLPPGRGYTLRAEKPGFVAQQYGSRGPRAPGTPLNLVGGQEMTGVDIVMTPQAVISGRVTDQAGDPVYGAQVRAEAYAYLRGSRQLIPVGGATTNDEGDYRISGVAPGRFYLRVEIRRSAALGSSTVQTTSGTRPPMDVTTYFPNALDLRNAAPVTVASGNDLRGMDIRMQQAQVFSISGKVVDANGAAPGVTLLRMQPAGGGSLGLMAASIGTQTTAPDGSFRFNNVLEGNYTIQTVNSALLNGQQLGGDGVGSLDLSVRDEDITEATLVLGPGGTITGTVSLEDGDIRSLVPEQTQNQANPGILNQILGRGPRLTLASADVQPATGGNAPLNSDGAFEFTGLPPGNYYLNALLLPPEIYIKTIRFNGQDVTHSKIALSEGGQLELLLSNKSGTVSGTVRNEDGEPQPGIQVTLWPKTTDGDRIAHEIKTGVTDQNGSFLITGVAPGEYYAASWDTTELGLTQTPDFLLQFTSKAEELDIAESATLSATLELIPAAAVAAALEQMP